MYLILYANVKRYFLDADEQLPYMDTCDILDFK